MNNKEKIIFDKIMTEVRKTEQNQPISFHVKNIFETTYEIFFKLLPMQYRIVAVAAILIGFFYSGVFYNQNSNSFYDEQYSYSLEETIYNPTHITYLANAQ